MVKPKSLLPYSFASGMLQRLLLLLNNVILLFVGTGYPAIGFGRLEVFLRGTLQAHELGGERTVMPNVDGKNWTGEWR